MLTRAVTIAALSTAVLLSASGFSAQAGEARGSITSDGPRQPYRDASQDGKTKNLALTYGNAALAKRPPAFNCCAGIAEEVKRREDQRRLDAAVAAEVSRRQQEAAANQAAQQAQADRAARRAERRALNQALIMGAIELVGRLAGGGGR